MQPALQDFIGEWRIGREIRPAQGAIAHFEGRAVFTSEGAGLRYVEAGVLSLPGQPPMHAERTYLWQAEGDQIEVSFADGRPFHQFSPDAPQAAHWCDPDDYRVRYDFSAWPAWRRRWA